MYSRYRQYRLDSGISNNLQFQLYSKSIPELDSDHCPVLLKTTPIQTSPHSHPHKIPVNNINWKHFQTLIDLHIQYPKNLDGLDEINSAITEFTKILELAAFASSPTTTNSFPKHNQIPHDISSLINIKHKIRHLWQIHRTRNLKRLLNQLIRATKYHLDKFRISSYQRYLASLSPSDRTLWSASKRLLGTENNIPPLSNNNSTVTLNESKAEIFADYFFSCFIPNHPAQDFNPLPSVSN